MLGKYKKTPVLALLEIQRPPHPPLYTFSFRTDKMIKNITFEKGGPYFLVGENGSGKTCMLEAIRRCMSSSKNIGASSSHKPNEDSVVVCKFDIPDDKMVAISGVVYIGNDKRPRNNGHDAFVKFVCLENQQRSDQENRYDLYVDLLKKDANNWAVNGEILMDQKA